jgi:hypothetical protein
MKASTLKLSIVALSVAAGLIACGRGTGDTASQDDFKRDLQLASSTNLDLAAPKVDPSLLTLESKAPAAPAPATTIKKGPGSRAVRSETPTVTATPDVDVAAVAEESAEVETIAEAPAPVESTEPVAVAPRPSPVVIQTAGGGSGDYGRSGTGVIFGGGSVIRGGGVDGDNCEIHSGGRRPTRTTRGPIFVPNPSLPRIGGMGGARTAPRALPTASPVSMRPRASR